MNRTDRISRTAPALQEAFGEIDEVVMHDADVHLESLGEDCFMLIIENAQRHLHLRIHYRKGRRVGAHIYEELSGEEVQQRRKMMEPAALAAAPASPGADTEGAK